MFKSKCNISSLNGHDATAVDPSGGVLGNETLTKDGVIDHLVKCSQSLLCRCCCRC